MTRLQLNLTTSMEIGVTASSWWNDINESTFWQDRLFYYLCAVYALVSAVALVSLFLASVPHLSKTFWYPVFQSSLLFCFWISGFLFVIGCLLVGLSVLSYSGIAYFPHLWMPMVMVYLINSRRIEISYACKYNLCFPIFSSCTSRVLNAFI